MTFCPDTTQQLKPTGCPVGGVNHCSLHCRLAKFRGLTRRGKYGAVIGQKTRFFVCAQYELSGYGFLFSQSQRRISPFSSNQGISPNDRLNYSQTVVDPSPNPTTYFRKGKLFNKALRAKEFSQSSSVTTLCAG